MSDSGLFRPEVEQARRRQYDAELALTTSGHTRLAGLVALASIVGLVAVALLASHSSHKAVQGRLEPASGIVSVSAPQPGVVVRLLVREGQRVAADQPIAELSFDVASAEGAGAKETIRKQLALEQEAAQARLAESGQVSRLRLDDLRNEATKLQRQLVHARARERMIDVQIANAESILRRMSALVADGFISQLQIDQQRTSLLSLKSEREAILTEQVSLQAELHGAQNRLAAFRYEDDKTRDELRSDVADLASRTEQNDSQRRFVVRAPVAGVVSSVIVHPGQALGTGAGLVSLVDEKSPLQAVFYVPSEVVPFVKPGDTIALKLDAYPYQVFGTLPGRVTSVSRVPIASNDLASLIGADQAQPLYRMTVEPAAHAIVRGGRRDRITPGLTCQSELTLDERRIYEWILFKAESNWKGAGGN